MQEHIDNVLTFMEKAGQKVPQTLTIPSEEDRILRARLILEEAFELINKGLGLRVYPKYEDNIDGSGDFNIFINAEPDPVEAIDGALDLQWVGVTGVAAIFGLTSKMPACLAEVDRSNLSKFIDGHRREDGKWVKGKSYSPADLKSIIEFVPNSEMSTEFITGFKIGDGL